MTDLPLQTSFARSDDATALFTMPELRRVGVAATMVVVVGTAIILTIMVMTGHYSSLSHCGPKAVLDGAVIALLIGPRGRWRCLTLLGVVYGLVLLLQIGVFYLLPVMALAGLTGAVAGRMIDLFHRSTALVVAAIVYEVFAGFGAPIKIYFATSGASEPFLWGLWFAEWPLRMAGAGIGVWVAMRWLRNRDVVPGADSARVPRRVLPLEDRTLSYSSGSIEPLPIKRPMRRAKGIPAAALRVAASIVACVLPMVLHSPRQLGVVAFIFVLYAFAARMKWRVFSAGLGLLFGASLFGLFSYAWHHDMNRAIDLIRTFMLRFTPITMASIVLVATTRPVDVIRLLRKLFTPGIVLIPLSSVIRSIPQSRREFQHAMHQLKTEGIWTHWTSPIRKPRLFAKRLIGPQIHRWSTLLAEDHADNPARA